MRPSESLSETHSAALQQTPRTGDPSHIQPLSDSLTVLDDLLELAQLLESEKVLGARVHDAHLSLRAAACLRMFTSTALSKGSFCGEYPVDLVRPLLELAARALFLFFSAALPPPLAVRVLARPCPANAVVHGGQNQEKS